MEDDLGIDPDLFARRLLLRTGEALYRTSAYAKAFRPESFIFGKWTWSRGLTCAAYVPAWSPSLDQPSIKSRLAAFGM
jgi:hypothetical protein